MAELEPPKLDPVVPEPDPNPEPTYTPTEKDALDTGWVPKDQWKGAEEDWVPAKAYLKYGQVESELKRVRSESSQKEKVIGVMKNHYTNVREDVRKEIQDSLRRAKRDAVKAEDYPRVAEIDTQLEEISDSLDRKFKQADAQLNQAQQQVPVGPPPEFYEWNRRNSWYQLNSVDPLSKEADTFAVAYANTHPSGSYGDMLNYVSDKMKRLYPEKFEPRPREREAVNEPGTVLGDGGGGKKAVRLTAAERSAAEAFGMDPTEFAASLKQWDKMKGIE